MGGVIVLHGEISSCQPSAAAKKYCIRSGFVVRQIGGECTIIPLDETSKIKNAVMVPNDTAAYLWNLFGQPCTLEEAVQRVLEEFDGPEQQIRADVAGFIRESLQMQVLEEVI